MIITGEKITNLIIKFAKCLENETNSLIESLNESTTLHELPVTDIFSSIDKFKIELLVVLLR